MKKPLPSAIQPPRRADRLLAWFCPPDLLEEMLGDLHEEFAYQAQLLGEKRARRRYWWEVLGFLRSCALRQHHSTTTLSFRIAMFKNYLKVAWRNLLRQKMYSAVKIGGFALGIAACLLIALFIRHELSYDRQYPDGERIYRVVAVFDDHGTIQKGVAFPAPMGPAMLDDFPEVEQASRLNTSELFGAGTGEVRPADRVQNQFERGLAWVDQAWLDMLQLPMVYGTREVALATPQSIVITRQIAEEYFPDQNPVGKQLIINNNEDQPFTIGGVIEDFPANSQFDFHFLMTMTGREFWQDEQTSWGSSNYTTFVKLRPSTDPEALAPKLTKGIMDKYVVPMMREEGVVDIEERVASGHLVLQPIADVHLYSDGIGDRTAHGDIQLVWIFGIIAGFILLIACINFINLSTAKSANRAMEVGLRKVVGSDRRALISQFLTESILFSVCSFVLGLLLAWSVLPYFNEMAGKALLFPWQAWWLVPVILGGALLVGTLAGLYPSFYLSSFQPIQVLKGSLRAGSRRAPLRNLLVVFQFTISIVLIIGTGIIYRQMHYILHKKLGFDKDQVVLIQGAQTLGDQTKTFKQELTGLSDVRSVTVSDFLPVSGMLRNGNTFFREGKQREEAGTPGQIWNVDEDYISTMGMHLLEGRNFSPELASDSQAVVINQAFAREMGLKQPLGQRITNGYLNLEIIGVVEDFHFESMRQAIEPLCLRLGNSPSVVAVKISSNELPRVLASIEGVWKNLLPYQPMRYTFLDEQFARMYDDVRRTGLIFTAFAGLAVVVACLGLFALAAFMTEQRAKEISIRLVLGASLQSIFRLLTQNFLGLVLLSLALAVPIAWYAMHRWLQNFAYPTELGWELFAGAGVAALLIALLTISYQALRAALTNPVDGLRSE
ncbi:putative ABC transport system permease protein [Catalinimonas alkaloidigena]|uniref:Putative ABC transport system permease protein n=1 Tax=Catalinimonas alkaloidigena TaxID=1075417 RepID=A0A1G9KG76_9BACT|nr:ABC transporter permease [Catalinimonas alkaloidigena]SDL48622.1 putative ABC transport system permease protein [Catalinimonas alkaloidigena]